MRFPASFTASLLATASLTAACNPPANQSDDGPFKFGPDEFPPTATLGWKLNHFALNVANLTASMHFYTQILGMREIFTLTPTDTFKIAYLGHPSGGVNGSGYQTPEEMNREKNNQKGLLELLWVDPNATGEPADDLISSSKKSTSFAHIGLVVPDPEAAQKRMEEEGVEIVKPFGNDIPEEAIPAFVAAYGLGKLPDGEGKDAVIQTVLESIMATGSLSFLVVKDPDGNLVEVQPLIESAQ